ncbi:MAG TPA: ROK family protein [Coriobacteriia bacterium]
MARASYAVGVDVGGTKVSAGLVERKGRVVADTIVSTPAEGPFAIVDAVIEAVETVLRDTHPSEVAGAGLGLPAQIDWHRQTIEFCTNLPLAGVDVHGMVQTRLNIPVVIDNDGEVAAIGEARFGAAKGVRDFLMVTMGTGVGGGLWLGGRPYRGSRGFGGEIGHILVEFDGKQCPCGALGHLEAYASRFALVRDAREAAATYAGAAIRRLADDDLDAITDDTLLAAARGGDDVARDILERAADVFGKAMVGVVNLLNPQLIVVGGGLGQKTPLWVDAANGAIQRSALAGRADVLVVPAELGNGAGVVGAAALAFDEYDAREEHRA